MSGVSAQDKLLLIVGLAGLYVVFRVTVFRRKWRRVKDALNQPRPPEP